MYHLVLPSDLKRAAAVEKRKNRKARTSISFQRRTPSTSRGNTEPERSILGTTDGLATLVDLRLDDIAPETCISDDVSTLVFEKTEEQFDFYPSWSEREEKRWYHRDAPRGTWETTLSDHLTKAPYSYNQELLLHRTSSVKEMASKSSKSRQPTYISSVLRNGDGSRWNSNCDMVAKKYTSQKSRLVTAQEKTEHFATGVGSPENVDKRRGSLSITSVESTLLASCTVARQTFIDQKENFVTYSAAVIKQDAQIKPVVQHRYAKNFNFRQSEGPSSDLHISELKKCNNSTSGPSLETSECNKPPTKPHQSEADEVYSVKPSIQRPPVYNQPTAISTLPLKTEIEENFYQKRCSTAENMSDLVYDEFSSGAESLDATSGEACSAEIPQRKHLNSSEKTSPWDDQDSNHLGDLHTNALISQAVQMNPVKIETKEKQLQTMRKRTESTLDKDTLTVVSVKVSSDSNTTLHSDTSSQVFPTEEDIQTQAVW
ncbi:hypothetical protein CRM22_000273 [Opisthorchis felineus]|uniref:Uncharacterized protein n=1 Tax=Opisthorchis felineus TaxID=147828 RepID=A0A4S2MFU5_OPIFE|nr:hypothetical protein CRM22_000273 [Opisthorchis felineus]